MNRFSLHLISMALVLLSRNALAQSISGVLVIPPVPAQAGCYYQGLGAFYSKYNSTAEVRQAVQSYVNPMIGSDPERMGQILHWSQEKIDQLKDFHEKSVRQHQALLEKCKVELRRLEAQDKRRAEELRAAGEAAEKRRQAELQLQADRAKAQQLADQDQLDMEVYDQARSRGKSRAQAMDEATGPVWIGFAQTKRFINRLAENVYGFDQSYLTNLAKLLDGDKDVLKNQLLISVALLPYLKAFAYEPIKQRYVAPSVDRLESELKQRGISSLSDLEVVPSNAKRTCLTMMASSLQSALTQMAEDQKGVALELLKDLAHTLASSGDSGPASDSVLAQLERFESLFKEMAQNPYLAPQAATDLALVYYLRDLVRGV